MRRYAVFTAVTIAVALLFLFTPTGRAVSEGIQDVFVTNFPDVQRVEGDIRITTPVRLSEMKAFTDVLVPPVSPRETTRLVDAGTLETNGFSHVVLSLHGQVKGSVRKPGNVGAILIPDTPSVQDAFRELGMVHFSLEVAALGISIETPYFASNQPRHEVAFDSYRVLLYNTSDKTVTVNLFGYLTN